MVGNASLLAFSFHIEALLECKLRSRKLRKLTKRSSCSFSVTGDGMPIILHADRPEECFSLSRLKPVRVFVRNELKSRTGIILGKTRDQAICVPWDISNCRVLWLCGCRSFLDICTAGTKVAREYSRYARCDREWSNLAHAQGHVAGS